jgi:hypothetical protein
VKETNLQIVQLVSFQPYSILEKANYRDSKKIKGCYNAEGGKDE